MSAIDLSFNATSRATPKSLAGEFTADKGSLFVKQILVRAAVLTAYFDVARELNFNPTPALRRAGLRRAMLRDPDQRIPANAALDLLESSALLSGFTAWGLRMAELRQLSDFGGVSLLISHQRTLRDAISATIRFRHLLNESLAMKIEESGGSAVIREELMSERPQRQAIELAIGVLMRMCASVLGGSWRPRRVWFAHGAPTDLAVHRRVFPCGVDFDSECNGIVCAAADLDALNPRADSVMARHAQQFVEMLPQLESTSIGLEVRRAIYLGLPAGNATIECVAESLGLSPRTLQRQLGAAGASFAELLNDVRRQMARRYIESSDYPIGRIAELLGYATHSSFSRWYVAQFGVAALHERGRRGTPR
jgi:AraC-like DNA-binding protein